MADSERIKVVVRCRPLNEKEKANSFENIIDISQDQGIISIKNVNKPSDPDKSFTYDAVYQPNSKQNEIYDESFQPLINSVLDGFNGTIFAYGQTGTGKTYTMEGVPDDPQLKGVIPLSFEHIFRHIARSPQNKKYLVKVSYLEIYQEQIRDLLAKDQCKRFDIREKPETGIYIKGLQSIAAKSIEEIEAIMATGNANRTIGATNMNEHSSRSHAIFIITVECSELGEDGHNHIRVGKLNLVDLAGSERQEKTGAMGERFKESTKINLSLCALGNVISAIVDGKSSHIPYRDSKLTRLLQNSLGGNAKTIMVANVGPASYNYEETLMTLRYASRAKNIKNKPRINEDPKDATLRKYQEEILRLKQMLAEKGGKGNKKKKRKSATAAADEDIDKDMSEYSHLCKDQMESLEAERDSIINDHNMIKEEKEKILGQLEEREVLLHQEEQAQAKLGQRIKEIESKLLCGGKNIIDHTNDQQRMLEKQRMQIAEEKRKEREILQRLEATEESKLGTRETYESLQQEVETKTKKLRKLFTKLQSLKSELMDIRELHTKERRYLECEQSELIKEMKFKLMVMDNFVPFETRDKVLKGAHYDEDSDEWKGASANNSVSGDHQYTDSHDPLLASLHSNGILEGSGLGGSIYEKLYKSLMVPRELLRYSETTNRIIRPLSASGYLKIPLTNMVKRKLADPTLSEEESERYRPYNVLTARHRTLVLKPIDPSARRNYPVTPVQPSDDTEAGRGVEGATTAKRQPGGSQLSLLPNTTMDIVDVAAILNSAGGPDSAGYPATDSTTFVYRARDTVPARRRPLPDVFTLKAPPPPDSGMGVGGDESAAQKPSAKGAVKSASVKIRDRKVNSGCRPTPETTTTPPKNFQKSKDVTPKNSLAR